MKSSSGSGFVVLQKWVVSLVVGFFFALLSLAVLWGALRTTVYRNSDDIVHLNKKIDQMQEMKTDIANIKTDVSWIKAALVKSSDGKQNRKNTGK